MRMMPIDQTLKSTGSLILDAVAQALVEDSSVNATDLTRAMGSSMQELNGAF